MALKVEDLECVITSVQVLRGCSLELHDKEIVCLVGRNGAGKSSILKNIIGLYTSKKGRIIFNDRDIRRWTAHQRVIAGIAYSPEDSRLFPDLTVEENIELGLWITSKTSKTKSFDFDKAFLIFPPIKNLLKRKGGTLSGGEKKMVSISRALALNPSLLLLDESFEGLAPLVVKAFSNAMNTIRDDLSISILLAESNLHNASQAAERVYIIERGEIIFGGYPQDISRDENLLKIIGR
jgi:branched-chain amino acid transport system ATP-binding protein